MVISEWFFCSLVTSHNSLEHHWCSFRQQENFLVDPTLTRRGHQTRRRFVERFVAEAKTAVMHRHESFRLQLEESLDRFLWIHVNLAAGGRIVSANGQERDLDVVALADFLEAVEVGAVATMKNAAAIHFDDETAKAAVQV